jgi:hypothetical protein
MRLSLDLEGSIPLILDDIDSNSSYLIVTNSRVENVLALVVREVKKRNLDFSANFEALRVDIGNKRIQIIEPELTGMMRSVEFKRIVFDLELTLEE